VTDSLHPSLAAATSAIASDALDRLGHRDFVCDARIRPLWPSARVVGTAMPIVVVCSSDQPEHPYQGEMDALDSLQPGDVAVYQTDHGCPVAAWGELFACGAIGRGAVGAICDGYVRDASQLEQLGFPTFAAGYSPLDTFARAVVKTFGDKAVCGGVAVRRGDVIVADVDGVVVIPQELREGATAEISKKRRLEEGARDDLRAGMRIKDVWNKYGVF
jgi:4-hydroxy-4-methyl-2-oxoglutarate aldolase